MWGKVVDSETLAPISDAIVDVWQASTNGKYDFQDPENQTPNNLRGKFRTDGKGEYWFYLLRPTAYSLPTDGERISLRRCLKFKSTDSQNRPCWCHSQCT